MKARMYRGDSSTVIYLPYTKLYTAKLLREEGERATAMTLTAWDDGRFTASSWDGKNMPPSKFVGTPVKDADAWMESNLHELMTAYKRACKDNNWRQVMEQAAEIARSKPVVRAVAKRGRTIGLLK